MKAACLHGTSRLAGKGRLCVRVHVDVEDSCAVEIEDKPVVELYLKKEIRRPLGQRESMAHEDGVRLFRHNGRVIVVAEAKACFPGKPTAVVETGRKPVDFRPGLRCSAGAIPPLRVEVDEFRRERHG